MDSLYHVTQRVHRTRQIALLLSDQDRKTALAYAAELEQIASRRPSPPRSPRDAI